MIPDSTAPNIRWSARRTRRNITLLGLAAFVVLLLLGSAFVVDRLRTANRVRLERINLSLVQLSEFFGLLKDMQTAQRGYLLSGDDTFLAPYDEAVRAYPEARANLASLIDSADGRGLQLEQELSNLLNAAQRWQQPISLSLEQRRLETSDPDALQQQLAEGKAIFDQIRSSNTALATQLQEQRLELSRLQNVYSRTSLILFLLIAAATLTTLGYGISLLRRVGFLASALQGRQKRQDAYTEVISSLNGPTQLAPLLHSALPQLVDSVGAQAAVMYTLEEDRLVPAHAVGLDPAALHPLPAAAGLPGRALNEGRMLIIDNEASDTAFHIPTGLGIAPPHGVAYLPLRYGRQSLGVLVVASLEPIDPDETQQLVLTASQLATAISTVRAFEATQQLADELSQQNERLAHSLETSETMQEIGRELVIQSDLQTLLTLVCSEARRLLRADYSAVATICDAEGSTRWVAVDGVRSQRWQEHIFPPHRGMAGRAIDQAGPVILEKFDHDLLPVEEFPLHLQEGMRSALGVPLFRKETPIGALIVAYRSVRDITPSDIDLAQSLASYASIAIENARLLTELQGERDLAEQRARELAAKNKEVERANRLKSEFMANMSHELRTPLNSILALSQILLDRLDGDLTPEQQKQVGIIERNGRNLLRLINDILDLSKIEAGRVELSVGAVSVPDLVSAVRSTVAPLAAQKNVELRTEVASDLPTCYTDENKLKQVLLNLLSNAVKFTERGSVTVRASAGRSGGRAGDTHNWVTFEVQDTGIGIALEDQDLVWEEFRQIDGSLSRRYEGTGLGLAIVRRLVTMLGGEIVLESTPGQGSTFRFWLPTHIPEQPTPVVTPVSAPAQPQFAPVEDEHTPLKITPSRPLVLIVDDDIEVIYILEKYLRDEGYQIEVAQTGDEAVAKARQLKPFAMTLDVSLPGRDGWEVMQELKSDPTTNDIPIIMISMLDNRQFGYRLGAADYLVKPVSRSDLLQRLDQLRAGMARLETALIVDDDPTQVRVIAQTLRDVGLEVATCSSGGAALAWLDAHTPDLITLDLMMPGMDGFVVLELLRARPHLRNVPVLVVTAKDIMPEDRQRLNGSIAAIIQKGPQQRDELLHELAELLRLHQQTVGSAQQA